MSQHVGLLQRSYVPVLLFHRDLCLVNPDTSSPSVVPWIAPSQTCSFWRASALGCSILWDTLLLRNSEATKALLSRSKDALLHVGQNRTTVPLIRRCSWSAQTDVICKSFAAALEQSHRIATLNMFMLFRLDWHSPYDYLKIALAKAKFPALHSLDIFMEDGTSGSQIIPQCLNPLLSKLLSLPVCTLTHLYLEHCITSSTWPILRTSTLKELQWIGLNTDIPSLFLTLKNNPTVENLHLFVTASEEDLERPVQMPVSLANLRELIVLSTRPSSVLCMLEAIHTEEPPTLLVAKSNIPVWSNGLTQFASIVRKLYPLIIGPPGTVTALPLRSATYRLYGTGHHVQLSRPSHPQLTTGGNDSLSRFIRSTLTYRGWSDGWQDAVISFKMYPHPGELKSMPDILLCLLPLASHIEIMHLDVTKARAGHALRGLFFWGEFSARFTMLKRLEIVLGEDNDILNDQLLPDFPAWFCLEEICIQVMDSPSDANSSTNLAPMNSNSPAYRPPAEVICSILLFHRDLCLVNPDTTGPNAVPWLSPSQACSFWRASALECPTLWDTLLLFNLEATRALLLRSKDASLHVGQHRYAPPVVHRHDWSAQTDIVGTSLVAALNQSHRIATLNLFQLFTLNWDSSYHHVEDALATARFPGLRSLDLYMEDHTRISWTLSLWLTPFLANLSDPPGCSLTHLNVEDGTLPIVWSMLRTSTLRELQWVGPESDLPPLFQALENNPTLENIHLLVLTRTNHIDWAVHKPVSLVHLRELIVLGIMPSGVTRVLETIDTAHPVALPMIRLQTSIRNEAKKQLALIVRHLSHFLVGPQSAATALSLRSVVYRWDGNQDHMLFSRPSHPHLTITGNDSLNRFVRMTTNYRGLGEEWENGVFSLTMFPHHAGEWFDMPDMLHCLLPLASHIETMCLDLSKFPARAVAEGCVHWLEFSSRFEMLKRLEIFLGEGTEILNDISLPDPPAWSSLEEVLFRGSTEIARLWLKLWLKKRKVSGNVLRKLTIEVVLGGELISSSEIRRYFDGQVLCMDVHGY
ncbi:hypothetical protein DL96DRAFT_1820518 [Flagelloscypha sp. PMI_526]|nr:hypothetical protein DL96DRAFT_1820518 [Flagelloscypha sp. PMI_526]